MYHRTTPLQVGELAERERKAKTQEDKILNLFKETIFPMTASMVWKYLGQKGPLTSYRRGMSDLVKEGKLIKTDLTRTGIYGHPERLYKYIPSL